MRLRVFCACALAPPPGYDVSRVATASSRSLGTAPYDDVTITAVSSVTLKRVCRVVT